MPSDCCIPTCSYRYKKDSGIILHRFPLDEKVKKIWLDALNLKDFEPSTHSRICSYHFNPHSYSKTPKGRVVLKLDAIPINYQEQISIMTSTTTSPLETLENENLPAIDSKCKRQTYLGDFKVEDLACPVTREKFWNIMVKNKSISEQKIKLKNREILKLKRTIKYLERKIEYLEKVQEY